MKTKAVLHKYFEKIKGKQAKRTEKPKRDKKNVSLVFFLLWGNAYDFEP